MADSDKQINIKDVPAELLKRAKIMAVEKGTSLSAIIRELLAEEVEEYETKEGEL